MPPPNSFLPRQRRRDPVRDNAQLRDVSRLRRVRLERLGCAQRHDVESHVRHCLARSRAFNLTEVSLVCVSVGGSAALA